MLRTPHAHQIRRSLLATLFVCGATTTLHATAAAQDAANDETVKRETITVTARRRTESIQEFSGSISAIGAETLANAQAVNAQDLRDLVPNLYLEEDLGGQTTTKIFVRGIGVDNPDITFDSPVGIYMDGVYMARAFGSLVDLYDVERVEVLRGPQGTLYGRNNSAGAVRIITKAPNLEEAEFGGSLAYGTEAQRNTQGYFSAPIVEDKLAARAAFATRANDGFMTETTTNQRFKRDDLFSARASLLLTPNDAWEISLRGDYLRDQGAGTQASSVVPAFNADDDIYTFTTNLDPSADLKTWGTSLELDHDAGDLTFTSVTAYRGVNQNNYGGDADGTPLSLLEGLVQELDEFQLSEEAFVTASSDFGGMNVDWTAGVFLFSETNKVNQTFNVFPATFGPATTQVVRQETDAYAAYVEADFALTDRFTLTGGLRFTDESKDVSLDSFNPGGALGFEFDDGIALNRVTWHAAADYAASDDLFFYASAGTGFRSGGFGLNPAARSVGTIVNDIFGPELATSYEAGTRATFLNGRARLNATYFYVEYESLQLAVAGAGGITVNTPDATVHGLEAELWADLSDQFSIYANLGTQNDDIGGSTASLKNTPGWQARLGATLDAPAPALYGDLTFNADVSYTDDYFVDTANGIPVDGYPLVNASVSWNAANGHWGVTFAGKNLTDEYYPIHGFRIVPGLLDNQFPNHPRRWLVTLTFRN